MRRKFLTVALVLLAVFGVQIAGPSSPANAWSGNLAQCGAFPSAWQSEIKADSRYNANTSWVAFKRAWYGPDFYGYPALAVIWNSTTHGQIQFQSNGVDDTSNVLNIPGGASLFQVLGSGLNYVGGTGGGIGIDDLTCVLDVHNVAYIAWYSPNFSDSVTTNTGALEYVAMGDSYSSGEGVSPFLYGTNTTTNKCHRSENAYPMLLDKNQDLDLKLMGFVACSGATTDTVLNGGSGSGGWSESAQINALSSTTDRVTITIGGNDAGFASIMAACAHTPYNTGWGCSSDVSINNDLTDRLDALAGTASGPTYEPGGHIVRSVLEVIEEIATEAPNASIFIGGYPELFGDSVVNYQENLDAPGDATCTGTAGATFSFTDTQWLNSKADELNQVIKDATDDARDDAIDVTYVAPVLFAGHGLCDSGSSYIYDVLLDSVSPVVINPGSLHPDEAGHSIAFQLTFEATMD